MFDVFNKKHLYDSVTITKENVVNFYLSTKSENIVKKHLGDLLPCTDNEFMRKTYWRWVFKKLRAMKMSPDLIQGRSTSTNYAMDSHNNMATATLKRTTESLLLVTGHRQTAGNS